MVKQPYNRGKIEMYCAICNALMLTTLCHVLKNKKYCSVACFAKSKVGAKRPGLGLKLSSLLKGRKMPVRSLKHRQNLSKALKGRPANREAIEKMRLKIIGITPKLSKETREKRRIMFTGVNNPNWKGGITPIVVKIRTSKKYLKWRKSVFERDGWACVWCGAKCMAGSPVILNADHIKPFALFPELRFAIDNGRTLCKPCHKTTDTYGSRTRAKTKVGGEVYSYFSKINIL